METNVSDKFNFGRSCNTLFNSSASWSIVDDWRSTSSRLNITLNRERMNGLVTMKQPKPPNPMLVVHSFNSARSTYNYLIKKCATWSAIMKSLFSEFVSYTSFDKMQVGHIARISAILCAHSLTLAQQRMVVPHLMSSCPKPQAA